MFRFEVKKDKSKNTLADAESTDLKNAKLWKEILTEKYNKKYFIYDTKNKNWIK